MDLKEVDGQTLCKDCRAEDGMPVITDSLKKKKKKQH
jgi:hypothetical protein